MIDLRSPQAQVVIGVRRSGKSTLCYQALHHAGVNFAYADFDDERLTDLQADQFNDMLEVLYKIYGDFTHLFLDEIQNVRGWHLFVNRMLRRRVHVVITGSNARLLSGELATYLTGRSREIPLYPFSFGEFCLMRGVEIGRMTTKAEAFRRAAFDEYMRQGGFPEVGSVGNSEAYVGTLVGHILKRDIEQRHKIAYTAAFEKMSHHLLNVSPTIISSKDLAGTFHFKTEHTARNYVGFLKQAYLLTGVQKFSPKSKVRAVQEKVYATDVAMMSSRENAFADPNLGFRLETVVLSHLVRKCRLEGCDVFYLSERSGECDFLICKGNSVLQAIQVCYDLTSERTRKRELSGLALAARHTGCDNLLLLTDHERGVAQAGGHSVTIQPVYEWCIEVFAREASVIDKTVWHLSGE